MQNNQPLLSVSHLSKTFCVGKQKLQAVIDVSLQLHSGEILGIVGESGCGKSTLAKILAGSLPPSSGSIALEGLEYTKLKGGEKRQFRRQIQMVFQDPLSSFSPRMKIGAYLREPRCNYDHVSKEVALQEVAQLLEKVGLPQEFLLRYPHQLSGGQLQRVAIARALAISPRLLICDEATGALDVTIQNQIAQLLVQLVEEQHIGCLFIGHDLALVRSVSQRIAVMYLGRFVEHLDSENLLTTACHPYTKALLASVFDVYCDQFTPIKLLEGEPPSPLQLQPGCAFAPRCTRCSNICREKNPPLQPMDQNHFVACWNVK